MRRTRIASISVLGVLILGGATSSFAADACAEMLPPALRIKIIQQYKDFVLPKQSDYSQDDISFYGKHGATGCPAIVMGYYYQSGNPNFAFLIASKTMEETLLIVADRATAGWSFEVVYNWDIRLPGAMYVAAAGPGTYKRTEAYDGPTTDPGERESYSAQREGIEVGKIGSAHGVFFFDGKAWVHVWTSD